MFFVPERAVYENRFRSQSLFWPKNIWLDYETTWTQNTIFTREIRLLSTFDVSNVYPPWKCWRTWNTLFFPRIWCYEREIFLVKWALFLIFQFQQSFWHFWRSFWRGSLHTLFTSFLVIGLEPKTVSGSIHMSPWALKYSLSDSLLSLFECGSILYTLSLSFYAFFDSFSLTPFSFGCFTLL